MEAWDIRIDQLVSRFQGYAPPTNDYVVSHDRSKIAGCSEKIPKMLGVWDTQTGEKLYEFPWDGFLVQNLFFCFTPNGQKLFCGNSLSYKAQCVIKGWDLSDGQECFHVTPT